MPRIEFPDTMPSGNNCPYDGAVVENFEDGSGQHCPTCDTYWRYA